MSLVPYEPFRHLDNIRNEIDRFFTDDFPFMKTGKSPGHLRVDVYETADEVVAECEIPGLEKKEDINIDVDNNVLTITGSLARSSDVKEENMHRRERFMGRFQRLVALPTNVDSDNVNATYKNGVLEIRMKKIGAGQRRKIDVQFH